jgi:hypothetical protein
MTQAFVSQQLAYLHEAGLLSAAQSATTQDHPGLHELAADADLGKVLAWLLSAEILDDPGLVRATRHVDATCTGKHQGRLHAAIAQALYLVAERPNVNKPLFDGLQSIGLITRPERHRALAASDPGTLVAGTPAAALAWMGCAGVVSLERLKAIGATRSTRRNHKILSDLQHRLFALELDARAGPPKPPGWLERLALKLLRAVLKLLLIGGLAGAPMVLFNLVITNPLPECSDPVVAKKVRNRLQERDLYAVRDGWGKPDKPAPIVERITQVYWQGTGKYRWMPTLRTCKADIKVRGTAVKYYKGTDATYYFDIRIDDYAWDDFTLTDVKKPTLPRVYDPAIDGPGAPLGAAELERAFRTGIAAIADRKPDSRLALTADAEWALRRKLAAGQDEGTGAAPPRRDVLARMRDGIGRIEPLGACAGQSPLQPYRCRVRVEYYSPSTVPGAKPVMATVEGDVSFRRARPPGSWETTPQFADELDAALARVKTTVVPVRP